MTQLQRRNPTDLAQWTVVEDRNFAPAQPAQPIYHVHLSGGPAWITAIGQLPLTHLAGIAAIVGSLGGVVLVAFLSLLASLATVAGIAIVGIVATLIATLALSAMVRS